MQDDLSEHHRMMQEVGLQKARDAFASMSLSPRERHLQKVQLTLQWLHGWGQSTATILMEVNKSSRQDFLTGMATAGLIKQERVLGRVFWLLTRQGVEMLRSWSPKDDPLANLQATRSVNLYAFSHGVTAQRLLARKIKEGPRTFRWRCDRELKARLAGDLTDEVAKAPDAFYSNEFGGVYLEIERSKKKTPELEHMLLNLARLIESKPQLRAEIHISPGIAERYRSILGDILARRTFRAWSVSAEDGSLFVNGIYKTTDTLLDAYRRISLIDCVISAG